MYHLGFVLTDVKGTDMRTNYTLMSPFQIISIVELGSQ